MQSAWSITGKIRFKFALSDLILIKFYIRFLNDGFLNMCITIALRFSLQLSHIRHMWKNDIQNYKQTLQKLAPRYFAP